MSEEKDTMDQFTTDLKNCDKKNLFRMLKRIVDEIEERAENN
jgi:hypothetical protein